MPEDEDGRGGRGAKEKMVSGGREKKRKTDFKTVSPSFFVFSPVRQSLSPIPPFLHPIAPNCLTLSPVWRCEAAEGIVTISNLLLLLLLLLSLRSLLLLLLTARSPRTGGSFIAGRERTFLQGAL